MFSHPCCHDEAQKFNSGLPLKGCQIRCHKIKEDPDSDQPHTKQRAQLFYKLLENYSEVAEPYTYNFTSSITQRPDKIT